jgi:hypothetical protein
MKTNFKTMVLTILIGGGSLFSRKCPGCINNFKKDGRCNVLTQRHDRGKYNNPYGQVWQ